MLAIGARFQHFSIEDHDFLFEKVNDALKRRMACQQEAAARSLA